MQKLTKAINLLLGLFLFLLPWQTIWIYKEQFLNGAKWQYGTLGFYATEIILWACIVLLLIWFWKKKKIENPITKFKFSKDRLFLLSLLLFILYSLLSAIWAFDADISSNHALHITEAIFVFLILFIGPIKFHDAMTWFVAGSIVQSLLGIFQFLTQWTFSFKWLGLVSHPVWEAGTSIISSAQAGRWLRAYGAFNHPNIFGGYLVISLIITTLLILNKNGKNKLQFCILNSAFLIQIAALFLTFSRSAWITLIIFFIGISIYEIKNKNRQVLYLVSYTMILLAILSLIYSPIIKTRFSQNSINEVQSTTERLNGYQQSWKIFKQNIILGAGSGNYTVAAYNSNPSLPGWEYQPAHNVPLLILTELGLVGVFLILLILLLLIKLNTSKQSIKNNQSKTIYYLLITGYLLLLLFDHYLWSSYTGLILSALYLGIISRQKLPKTHS